jgi:hypothetical protein
MSESNQPSEPQDVMHIHMTPFKSDGSTPLEEGKILIYNVEGPIARRMIDLQLHKLDLMFVADCLRLLTHQHVTLTIESEAIWTAAMVRFFKCFSGTAGGRSQLSHIRILKTEPPEAMVSFTRLEILRNKTLVHDQNSFMQGKLGVPIAFPPNAGPRMGPLMFFGFAATTLDDESVSNLTLLTQCALRWIEVEYAELESRVVADLKEETAATIVACGVVTWTAPSHQTAGQTK